MLAEENVSYLEAILASPCMLSLVCFSLETQYGNVMLEGAQQQRKRSGPAVSGTAIDTLRDGYPYAR